MSKIVKTTFTTTVMYSYDERAALYSFFLLEDGGPMITAETVEEGIIAMKEALDVYVQVKNLLFFNDHMNSERAKEDFTFERMDMHNTKYRKFQVA